MLPTYRAIGRATLDELGQTGVERAIGSFKDEIERGMRLMGVTSVGELNRDYLRWRRLAS